MITVTFYSPETTQCEACATSLVPVRSTGPVTAVFTARHVLKHFKVRILKASLSVPRKHYFLPLVQLCLPSLQNDVSVFVNIFMFASPHQTLRHLFSANTFAYQVQIFFLCSVFKSLCFFHSKQFYHVTN